MTGVPKPPKRVKPSRVPLPRTAPPKRVTRKRKASEFARCYHSRARVQWIKSLPCIVCQGISPYFGGTVPSENAHTEGGGAGRKAGYETIAPLCPTHHKRYDEHLSPLDLPAWRNGVKLAAKVTQARWLALSGGR